MCFIQQVTFNHNPHFLVRLDSVHCPEVATADGVFCQAQPQIQLSWAELALILKYPASAGQPTRASNREAS